MRGCLVAVLIIFAVIFAGIALGTHSLQERAANGSASTPSEESATPAAAPSPAWDYSSYTDGISDGSVTMGCLLSTNEVHFDFPYQGENHGHLCFLERKRH